MVADVLARRASAARSAATASGCDVLEGRFAGARLVLAKPRSYMNVSGGADGRGGPVLQRRRPTASSWCTTSSTCRFGTVRVKVGGGEGGHNGLRSISAALGTKDYLRVRFGIGRPPGRMDPADFVLRDFSAPSARTCRVLLEEAADAVELLLETGPGGDPEPSALTGCEAARTGFTEGRGGDQNGFSEGRGGDPEPSAPSHAARRASYPPRGSSRPRHATRSDV